MPTTCACIPLLTGTMVPNFITLFGSALVTGTTRCRVFQGQGHDPAPTMAWHRRLSHVTGILKPFERLLGTHIDIEGTGHDSARVQA